MAIPVRTGRRAQPFVGRAAELEAANGCLAEALVGRGAALLLAGEAGIGKTMLAEQIARRAEDLGAVVAWGRCVQEEGTPPFWPWRQILGGCLRGSTAEAIRDQIGAGGAGLALLIPEVVQGEEGGGLPPLTAAPGGEDRFRLFEAVTSMLVRSAAPSGLVVVVDDLHWADASSVSLMIHLARELRTSRIMLVAGYRDREVGSDASTGAVLRALIREPGTVQLRLGGFAEVEVADQLEATFGHRFALDVVAGIARRSGGNPLFVSQLGRLVDHDSSGGPVRADGWATSLPDGVRAVIVERLDRMSTTNRDILRTAAVIGSGIDVATVAAAAEHRAVEVLAALDNASQAGLVTLADGRPGAEFSHDLMRETLRGEVPTWRRAEIHRRVAEHIEQTHPADLERHAAELAHHWLSSLPSGDAHTAVGWAERAAGGALGELAYERAALLLDQALAAMESGGFSPSDRCRVLLGRAGALFKAGDVSTAIAAASDAAEEARRAGDPVAMARAAVAFEGVADEAWGRRVVRIAELALPQLGDDQLEMRARLTAALATVHSSALSDGAAEQAEPLSRQALQLAAASGTSSALISALRARQMACADPDGVHDRLQVADRMVSLSAETNDPWAAMWGHLWRIEARCQLGEVDAAENELGALASVVERLHQPVAGWHLARTRCALAIGRGRLSDADRYLDEMMTLADRGLDARGRQMHWVIAAKLSQLTGDSKFDSWIETTTDEASTPSEVATRVPLGLWYAERGQMDRAADQDHRLPPWRSWRVPRFVGLVAQDQRARLTAMIGDVEGATVAYQRLLPWARYFVVGGSGLVAMHGSAEFALGCLAACIGDTDAAVRHLGAAVDANRNAGLPPFEAESRYELAKVLAHRGRPDDRSEALRLATNASDTASRLGMSPLQAKGDNLLSTLRGAREPGRSTNLTKRELEIAALITRGLTNRQIAELLYVAERTAENHVQHILTKLGLQNRTQIALWATTEGIAPGPSAASRI
jgi:DNA-binding CsgD family transcriptional regulator